MSDKFKDGDLVTVPGIGTGPITKTRHDNLNRAIYTVNIDQLFQDIHGAARDYYARDEELILERRSV